MKDNKCIGCKDDFYNGKNPLGVKECWSRKTAKTVFRIEVGVWERPPYNHKKAIRVLDCYRREGYCFVSKEALTKEGYWKW